MRFITVAAGEALPYGSPRRCQFLPLILILLYPANAGWPQDQEQEQDQGQEGNAHCHGVSFVK